MVRTLITDDDVDDLILSEDLTPERHRVIATTLFEWAEDKDRFELEPELPESYLLGAASDHATMAGDPELALSYAIVAMGYADDGTVLATYYGALLGAGKAEEAAELEKLMRGQDHFDLMLFEEMSHIEAERGELKSALRWANLGVLRADELIEYEDYQDFEYLSLLLQRSEVRRQAGLPEDDLDVEARELAEELND